jgi:molybdenum cofactor synthesis domain-containing protein
MKKIRVEDAVGQTLCHDMTAILDTGFKGVKFKRGHVITEADIPELKNIGKDHIFVWEPEADEVHEEDAAVALCEVMCGDNLTKSGPSEGKIQIDAAADGLFCINSPALRAINSVPDYTVACLPNYMPVKAGQKLAGARIVPLVTKRENVDEAVRLAKENFPVLSVKPFRHLKAGMVITGSEVYYGRIKDAFEPILTEKLNSYGAEILGCVKCPDDVDMITAAIDGFVKQGAGLILLTGGMSVDPDDVTPTAIRRTGARAVVQGVPMQPGNMLNVAYLGDTVLVGVPGASMHSKVTSLEVFLPRIFAGVEITEKEIPGYGEGGLCMGCKVCTYPKCYFGTYRG